MKGYTVCPLWLKRKYREAVNYHCQRCNNHEDVVGKLEPHRITRKTQGGLYTVVPLNHIDNNVKVLCNACHKKFHKGEYAHIGSRY